MISHTDHPVRYEDVPRISPSWEYVQVQAYKDVVCTFHVTFGRADLEDLNKLILLASQWETMETFGTLFEVSADIQKKSSKVGMNLLNFK